MAEAIVLDQPLVQEPIIEKSPFNDNSWTSAPVETTAPTTDPPAQEPAKTDTAASAEAEKIINSDEWVKQYYGWENAEAGKKELEELRKLREAAQTPAEHKFINEQSRKYYDAIINDKGDDLYNILHQQKQLERLEKLTLANTSEAAEIIKASLQFKHADLTPTEINFLYNKRYAIPSKPTQGVEQSDEDYAIQVAGWQDQVKEKEQEIIIEAKLAKPELSKYKSELVLPDIPKSQPQAQGADQESLAALEAQRQNFLKQLESGYKNFKGFETKVKDESVELPIGFNVPENEVSALYTQLQDFDINNFFNARWFDENGNAKPNQMMADLYLLNNPEKVFQGLVNNAATKRLEHHLKEKSNIKVDGIANQSSPNGQPDTKELEEKTIWSA